MPWNFSSDWVLKLFVFDWNGVLLSDVQANRIADNAITTAFGGKAVGLKTYRETAIIPSDAFYIQHGADKEELERNPGKAARIFTEVYEPLADKCHLRKSARQLLGFLAKQKISMIILSNHPTDKIIKQLNRLQIRQFFEEVLGKDSQVASISAKNFSKKQGKLKNYLLSKSFLQKEIAIIGDSPEEIEIGKGFEIKTIAIIGGLYSTERLKNAKPDFVIKELGEIITKKRILE